MKEPHPTPENYATNLLRCEYYSLKKKLMEAEKNLELEPNPYDAGAIDWIKPRMKDIFDLFVKLGESLSHGR